MPPAMRAAGAASAALTGSCSAGFEPAHAAANGAVGHGPFTVGQPSGDVTIGSTRHAPVAAYEVPITNTGTLGNGPSGPATGHQDRSIPSEGFATCQVVEWTSF